MSQKPTTRPLKVKISQSKTLSLETCKKLVLGTEPWVTYGFTEKNCRRIIRNLKMSSLLIAKSGEQVVGFAIYVKGFLNGFYLKQIVVDKTVKNQGVGRLLMKRLEQECFRKHKAVYLCVSHFNRSAQRFYRQLGYEKVGFLKDYSLKGVHEILMRKVKR